MVNNTTAVDIYILHSKTLPNRDQSVKDLTTKLQAHAYQNIKIGAINIIQSNDPSDIHINIIQQIIDYAQIQDPSLAAFNQYIRNIHINQLSHTLKHLDAFQQMNKSEAVFNVVIEDDALCGDDVGKKLDECFGMLDPKEHALTFIGLPGPETSQSIKPCQENALIPLIDSYIITKDAASLLSSNFLPIKFTSMFQMNYLIQKLKLKTTQTAMNIFMNGSRYGAFVSSLNPNNTLVFNPDYMTLYNLLNSQKIDDEKVRKLTEESAVKTSPDFMYLVAKYWTFRQQYKEAEKTYTDAYNIALTNGGIINHESTMLKDFIRLCKHLQPVS